MSSSAPAEAAAAPDRIVLDETDSTNAEAMRRAPERPLWILARRQVAGRGSRGRGWAMPEGNLAVTLALRQWGTPRGLSRTGFVAGLALHDALVATTGRDFALKWPNDVLMGGGKLAGVLLERETVGSGGARRPLAGSSRGGSGPSGGGGGPHPAPGDGAYTLAVGFGVNLASAPARVGEGALPAVSLGGAVTPEALLDALVPAWEARSAQAANFEAVRRDWLARAARLGETITARTLREARTGVFETIDGDGHLILRTERGRERIASADVFFEPPAARSGGGVG